jgi:hypothetical protein
MISEENYPKIIKNKVDAFTLNIYFSSFLFVYVAVYFIYWHKVLFNLLNSYCFIFFKQLNEKIFNKKVSENIKTIKLKVN